MKPYFSLLILVLALFFIPKNSLHSQCTGTGSEIHDDGSFENGYNIAVDSVRFVVKMQPAIYPWQYNYVCIGWTRSASGSTSLNYDVVVYPELDSNGAPGPFLVFDLPNEQVTDIPVMPEVKWVTTRIKVPYLLRKSYYIGVRYKNNPQTGVFVAADESSSTPLWAGYADTLGDVFRSWKLNQSIWSSYRCMAIRTLGERANDNMSCVDLSGGSEIHEDGVFEDGAPIIFYDTSKIVQKVQPQQYPWKYSRVCISFTRLWNNPLTSLDYDIIVYKDNGVNGSPGSFVSLIPGQHIDNIPIFPYSNKWNYSDIDIPSLESGSYYIGLRTRTNQYGFYIAADLSDSTPYQAAYHWNYTPYNFWEPDSSEWYAIKALSIRTEGYLDSLIGIVKIGTEVPKSYSLEQNYPNPFNPSTKIKFSVPKENFVEVIIYDAIGRETKKLVSDIMKPGTYEAEFDASNVTSGIYFYRITSKEFTQTKKMVLLK
jgi:hypothetical protein